MGRRFPVALLAALAAVMAVYTALHLRVGTDLTNFLPVGGHSDLALLSGHLADAPLTRTVVVSVGAPDLDDAIAAAGELTARLQDHPQVAWLRSRVGDADLQAIHALYFPRRLGFLSDEPETELPHRLSAPALRERARVLRERLASPASSLIEALVVSDPLGAFEGILERMRAGESALRMQDGQLVSIDGHHAIVLLGTAGSAFDSAVQGVLLADLHRHFRDIAAERGGDLVFEISAVGAYAVAAENAIKGDIYLIAVFTFAGVAALFGLLVGSLRGFLIVSIPPLAGILTATTAGLLVFGKIDGLTMAFGASLMGIAIDYSNHLLLHHGLDHPHTDPWSVMRRLRPSLVLGALTTAASFAGLGMTAFPAFREMAFFAITGVMSGLAVSLLVLPALLDAVPELPARSRVVAARLDAGFRVLASRSRRALLLPIAAGLALAAALPAVEWSDDMSRMTRFDPALSAEDQRVRERVAQLDGGRFAVAIADGDDAAAAAGDAVHARLAAAVAAGHLEGMRSLHSLLWSPELQRRNLAVLTGEPDLVGRVEASFAAEGFRPGVFAPFAASLRAPPPPLRMADLRGSSLADLLQPFVFDLGDRLAVVTYLRGIRDEGAVRAALAGLPGVHLLDQKDLVNDIYREFREASLRQILVGGGLVLALLIARYRDWRKVVAAFLPSVLVALVVLASLSAFGVALNLFHVMSLVMVMGMGVDYGIFCVDSVRRREDFGATLLSLLLSCLTTATVFGALVVSSQPSLRAIGLTTGVGVLLSYLLAPLTLAALGLAAPERSRHA